MITCPSCDSDKVVIDVKTFGICICLDCGHRWNEEDCAQHERKRKNEVTNGSGKYTH